MPTPTDGVSESHLGDAPTEQDVSTDDRRVLRIDCKAGGRDIMREVLEYRVGPAADWTFVRGTLILAGRSEQVDEDLKRQLMSATHDLQMEYSDDAIYDAAEDADRLESEISRTEIETWDEATVAVATVPPRELSLDDLRDEYWAYIPTLRTGRRERPPANYPTLQRRAVAVWTAIRERTDEQPPECLDCNGRNWTPAFVEPVECAECGTTVHSHGRRANQDLVEAVFEAWQTMIAAEERDADE